MATIKTQQPDSCIMLVVEFLANRLTPSHALYFKGNSQAQLVVNGNIPPVMQFEGDQLAETVKRIIVVLEASLKHKMDEITSSTKKKIKEDIEILKSLIEDC